MRSFKTTTNEYITEKQLDYIKSIANVEARRDEECKELGLKYRVQTNTPAGRCSCYVSSFEEAQKEMANMVDELCCYDCPNAVLHIIQIVEGVKLVNRVFYSKDRCFSEAEPFEVVIIDLYPKTRSSSNG